jgi:hypothetical protein
MFILNAARFERLSADRAIREHCSGTWCVPGVEATLD